MYACMHVYIGMLLCLGLFVMFLKTLWPQNLMASKPFQSARGAPRSFPPGICRLREGAPSPCFTAASKRSHLSSGTYCGQGSRRPWIWQVMELLGRGMAARDGKDGVRPISWGAKGAWSDPKDLNGRLHHRSCWPWQLPPWADPDISRS